MTIDRLTLSVDPVQHQPVPLVCGTGIGVPITWRSRANPARFFVWPGVAGLLREGRSMLRYANLRRPGHQPLAWLRPGSQHGAFRMSDDISDILKAQTALATLKQWLEDGLTLNDGARLEGAICLAEVAQAHVAALSAWAQRYAATRLHQE